MLSFGRKCLHMEGMCLLLTGSKSTCGGTCKSKTENNASNIWWPSLQIQYVKGVEKKTSPFDILIFQVQFDIFWCICEFGPKKDI